MGTRALEVVRFRGRYYIRYHQLDGTYENLGAGMISGIPTNAKRYQKWLERERAYYASREAQLERDFYEIKDDSVQGFSASEYLIAPPSELPRFHRYSTGNVYILNLDREVFTVGFGMHWKLGNLPQNNLWIKAITDSVYGWEPTISLDKCPDEHIASPALELPEENRSLRYPARIVNPKTGIFDARKAFLTRMMAEVLIQYKDDIVYLGMEWAPDSFPFRELIYSLVSIASDNAIFFSLPTQQCHPVDCRLFERCPSSDMHMYRADKLVHGKWAGRHAPLLLFGSPCHLPGSPPGVSPPETMYWLGGVLVSLALTVDGNAISQAVDWGFGQGRENFQLVVLSLFQAAFAEVSRGGAGEEPMVKITDPVNLSPMRHSYCMSTHPRERPELKDGERHQRKHGLLIMDANCTGTVRRMQTHFGGLAALVNFFEVAASRRAYSKLAGRLPTELYDRILDFVDYETWKVCTSVSTEIRDSCLRKYRIDEKTRIVRGPFVRSETRRQRRELRLSFDFEDMIKGKVRSTMQVPTDSFTRRHNWMPFIGSDRKALMSCADVQFKSAGDAPLEDIQSE
ncbi:hypothetical protein F4808DRAFT_470667 [Astrocystis sublimbata]|nr:hypothetical protein F4808DRAFT_470667 [Astrocystis sublimbata]